MKDRVNKPRAFLSYSTQDVSFVERIENDLRSCQIESWRDRTHIRDGRPWLESIFEEGLPTCDVIIAYFTENSLSSGMVAKEVDAAQIRQLQDNGISFLPYINQSEIRSKLRLDIQTLHCRVWNDENYHDVLPSVVAEIWRSYMERHVGIAVLNERNKRLQLELELQNLKTKSDGSTFTSQEEKEFRFIYEKLAAPRDVAIRLEKDIGPEVLAKFSLISLLMSYISSGQISFDQGSFRRHVRDRLLKAFPNQGYVNMAIGGNLSVELTTYGFVELKDLNNNGWIGEYFSPRLFRFRFWLEANNLPDEKYEFELVEKGQPE